MHANMHSYLALDRMWAASDRGVWKLWAAAAQGLSILAILVLFVA